MVKKINFLLLPLLLCMGTLSFANHLNLSSNPAENAGMVCPYQTPTNFQAIDIGTTFVKMGWTQPGALPPFYNMKAFEVVTNNQVYNVTFPNVSTNHTITGLTPGTWYRFELSPLDANMSYCAPPAITSIKTGIIDLIVAKNSLPDYICSDCTIDAPFNGLGPACDFPLNGMPRYFKIRKKANIADYRVFSFQLLGFNDFLAKTDDVPSHNTGNYSLTCPLGGPICFDVSFINIWDDDIPGNKIATMLVFGAANPNNPTPPKLICTALHSNYEIVRTYYCAPGLVEDPQVALREEGELLGDSHLSVAPNPFSNRLEINIPYATEENDVKIQLFDPHGRLILSQVTAGGLQIRSLDTEVLQPGMYLLRVETGERAETVKVIKTQ